MIRTQVYIPDDLYRELKLMAGTSGENFSSLIRRGVAHVVETGKKGKRREWGKGFIGKGHGGPKNLSSRIDYYLYGDGSKWGKR